MSAEGSELVATYYVHGRTIDVYGCWDGETEEGTFEFYDLYITEDKLARCINMGEPFFDMPTRKDVWEFILDNYDIIFGGKHEESLC